MGPVTPFAQTPATPEPIIAQVRRQLADDLFVSPLQRFPAVGVHGFAECFGKLCLVCPIALA